ncbi:MAG: type II secretion system protein J [Planctomycetota bacterium JB042]
MTCEPKRPSAGFTMMEFILVIGITGILVVGLGAVVEIPRQMAEQELAGDARISDVDRAMKWLDDDVRFARDVVVPSAGTLEITTRSGQTVTWNWGGSSGPLTRTDPGGTSSVIPSAARVIFSLGLSKARVAAADGSLLESTVESAAFDTFTLNSGYGLADLLPIRTLLTAVDLLVGLLVVHPAQPIGIVFTASGLSDDSGYLESIRLRVRRNGTSNLVVTVFEALESPLRPDRTKVVAKVVVENARLPAVLSDLTIALPAERRIHQGGRYFVELKPESSDRAVALETRVLSIAAAAASTTTGVLSSSDGGRNYSPIGGSLDASQTVFSVLAKKSSTDAAGVGEGIELIPTCVQATIMLVTADGVTTIDTSVPVENNLARVIR